LGSNLSIFTNLPPRVAWECITRPRRRISWPPWMTEVNVMAAIDDAA